MRATAAAVLAATLISGTAAAQDRYNLPSLGLPADTVLSPQEEAKLGADVVAQMYAAGYIVDDPQLNDYLAQIGWRLAAVGSEHPPQFHFYLIADNDINAFALPGGYIGVNSGLLVATHNESELAAVMAHEEAHVTQRHIARAANDNRVADLATWLAMLGAIIAGSANPNVVIGALSAGQAINYQRQINYTRGDEMEADRIGIRTLAAAGYDPRAMAEFFERLEQQSRLYGNQIPDILLTHPVDSVRVAEAQERAAQYPQRNVPSSFEYYLMRARARVLQTDLPSDAVAYYATQLSAGTDAPAERYGYAFALLQAGRAHAALHALQPLVKAHPDQPNVVLLQASVLLQLNQDQPAVTALTKLLSDYPRYEPAILADAEALLQSGQPEAARQVLLSHDPALATNPQTYRLLGMIARRMGDIAEAQYQMANYYAARGDLRRALDQLDAGLSLSNIRDQQRAKLAARRRELIANLSRDELRDLERRRRDSWR